MRSSDLSHAAWRKSSRSNDGGNSACVEVAGLADRVAVRDSKDPAGSVLAIPCVGWSTFLSSVRTGRFA